LELNRLEVLIQLPVFSGNGAIASEAALGNSKLMKRPALKLNRATNYPRCVHRRFAANSQDRMRYKQHTYTKCQFH